MARIRLPNWRDPRVRARLIVWLLALVMVFVTFVVSALSLTSTKWFCAKVCHEMNADIVAFDSSPHARISCYACHMPAGAGPVTFVLHKMKALPELVMHVAGSFAKPLNKEQKYGLEESQAADCTQCHNPNPRVAAFSPGIIMNHAIHNSRKIACAVCHNRVAHPDMVPYENGMSMTACFRCHSQETGGAVSQASAAQAGGSSLVDAAMVESKTKLEEMSGLKLSAPGDCSACHPKGFQLKPADHLVKGWLPKGHHDAFGKLQQEEKAAAEARKSTQLAKFVPGSAKEEMQVKPCGICHSQKFCNDCHGIQMPHPGVKVNGQVVVPGDFTQTHFKIAATSSQVCEKCHGGRDFCNKCHHKGANGVGVGTTAAWLAPTGHPLAVKATGAEPCFQCHDERLCSTCHIRGVVDKRYLLKKLQ